MRKGGQDTGQSACELCFRMGLKMWAGQKCLLRKVSVERKKDAAKALKVAENNPLFVYRSDFKSRFLFKRRVF